MLQKIKRVDDAIALFGDKEASGIVLMKGYKDYYFGYTDEKGNHKSGYVDMIDELTVKFPFEFFTGIMTDKDSRRKGEGTSEDYIRRRVKARRNS